jgi:phosphohistidine phosphatase SixA
MRGPLSILLLLAASAIDANAQQPKGALGIEAARRGGVVMLCRHGITDSADEDEQTLRYDDPRTQRRLSREGEQQAADLGKAFRSLGLPVAEVIASPMQRTRRTGELAFDTGVRLDSLWHNRGDNYGGPRRDRRAAELGRPVERGTRVIVSHIGTIYSVVPSIRGELEEGDCAVLRPRGDSRFDVVEVVPWRAWMTAAKAPRSAPR